jgi:predicted outer membrane repeat protein
VLIFDPANRCNVFLNFAGFACDLYAVYCNTIDVVIDTFTVFQPDDHFAYPIDDFTFDILNAKIEPINQDLYVSPAGSDANSGFTANEPLLTISYALAKILADSANPLTIHVLDGSYSPSQTGERFPLNCRSYISLLGQGEVSAILDGEELNGVLLCMNDNDFSIKNMTIQNGRSRQGGGIFFDRSSVSLGNVTVDGNSAWRGGGIYCTFSNPNLSNVTVSENIASGWIGGLGGGIYCQNSSPSMMNVLVIDNIAYGGLYCSNREASLTNGITGESIISIRQYGEGGGIYCIDSSNVNLVNVTISGNTAEDDGGGIYCENSSPSTMNCILWNDGPQEIYVGSGSVTVTYSDVEGGWPGVGNIDTDPIFVSGPLGDYHLSLSSLCIDTGNPSPQYNDPEDPLNPGYALWPALGTVRNDMGVYGGPGAVGWPGIEEYNIQKPKSSMLCVNPNPFRYSTNIAYQISNRGVGITLKVYDITGREVRDLTEQVTANGHQASVKWSGADDLNRRLPSGVYFLKLEAGDYSGTEKLLLIR